MFSVLPLSIGWIPSVFTSLSSRSWTDFLPDLSGLLPSSSQKKLEESLQQHLSAEEYSKLLRHIDQYIDSVVSQREQNRASSGELNLLIAKIIRENSVLYKYELTDEDVERIVRVVLERLKIDREVPVINQDLIEKITLSVQEGFRGGGSHMNTDEIVLKIVQSDHLSQLIDQRLRDLPLSVDTSKYDDLIAKLSLEITKIKDDLSKRENRDDDINLTLEAMRSQQENLAGHFYDYRQESDLKFERLLAEIEVKIANLGDQQYAEIDKQIRQVLVQIFNIDQNSEHLDENDLKSWIRNVFVAKEYLEARLGEIQRQFGGHVEEEIQRSAGILMANITDTLRLEILSLIEAKTSQNTQNNFKFDASEDHVRRIVREALAIYDADKTGLVDYALESAGGQVLSTRCTESYHTKTAQISIFGIPLWYPSNTPRTAISPNVQPGNCWAFQGFPGFLGECKDIVFI